MGEAVFQTPISALSTHPSLSNVLCFGFLDGALQCCGFDPKCTTEAFSSANSPIFEVKWTKKLKRAVRAVQFSEDGAHLYVTSSNRALCMFDVETGKRTRCIREAHRSRPNTLIVLPSRIGGQHYFATGAESGEIKTWDFRQPRPVVSTFKDQEDTINSFHVWKGCLLSASGDGTLAAYDLHKKKLRTKSELMHSELLSLAVNDKYTYVGAADGFIEVFGNGEFGNIRERIETPLGMGVEQLVVLRNNLLLASASTEDEMRFVHVNPNKVLDPVPYPGGTDLLAKTADCSQLVSTSADGTRVKLFPMDELLAEVPELRAQDMHTFKLEEKARRKRKRLEQDNGGFYKDLLGEQDEQESGSDEGEKEEGESGTEMDLDDDRFK